MKRAVFMFEAWIGLGANQGDSIATLSDARELLSMLSDQMLFTSSLYESEPWGGVEQRAFVNQVVRAYVSPDRIAQLAQSLFNHDWSSHENLPQWPLSHQGLWAEYLLSTLLMIERSLGRRRDADEVRWGPRVIDIDLLAITHGLNDHGSHRSPRLTLPHPRLHLRNFVLVPWAELAPQLIIPTLGQSVDELRRACSDPHEVRRIEPK